MDVALPAPTDSSAVNWSLAAGLYAFVCGIAVTYALGAPISLAAEVIGLPSTFPAGILSVPALVVGPLVWWTLVERRGTDGLGGGVAFGLVTALSTGLVWTVAFVVVWGVEMLGAGGVPLVAGFVLAATTVAGGVAGLPLGYARRRSRRTPAGGDAATEKAG